MVKDSSLEESKGSSKDPEVTIRNEEQENGSFSEICLECEESESEGQHNYCKKLCVKNCNYFNQINPGAKSIENEGEEECCKNVLNHRFSGVDHESIGEDYGHGDKKNSQMNSSFPSPTNPESMEELKTENIEEYLNNNNRNKDSFNLINSESIKNEVDVDVEKDERKNKDTFSVAHAIDALGFGKFQVILSLLTGLCWMSDSMEMTILSILAPALHCKLCIDKYQQAFLTNAVFMGMMISSPFWGNLSDRYGRRKALWASVGVLFFYGAVSAFSTGYYWLLFFRFFVGFAIGCTPQSVTLYAEFLPSKQRARCVVLLDCFWALGACLEVLLALLVMPTLGWQWLLGLSSVPIFFFFIMCYWLPESVRYLACAGQTEKAMTTLERIAEDNKRPMLLGRLVVDDMHPMERGRFKDLIRPEMRRTTLLLWFIWMSCAFCYYGVVFLSTEIYEQNDAVKVAKFTSTNITMSSSSISSLTTEAAMSMVNNSTSGDAVDGVCDPDRKDCAMLNTSDYVGLLWITLAEFPGILVTIFILDRIGRKKTMGIQFLLFAATIFAFIFHIEDRLMTTVILFLARGIVAGVFQAAYVYTPEVYPTSMRAIGIGTCSSMARIGAMLTPYVAQVLSQSSRPLAAACYAVAAIVAALLTMLLPIETKGKALPD